MLPKKIPFTTQLMEIRGCTKGSSLTKSGDIWFVGVETPQSYRGLMMKACRVWLLNHVTL
jgi:hypothetical protein